MQQTWTDTHFGLRAENQPIVTAHETCVALHLPGYMLDGQGFCLELTRAHLAMARKLVAALEALPPLPSERDTDPFAEDDACPLCTKTTEHLGFPCKACEALEAYSADH